LNDERKVRGEKCAGRNILFAQRSYARRESGSLHPKTGVTTLMWDYKS